MDIEFAFKEALDILERIIQIPSSSGKEKDVADFLEDHLNTCFPKKVSRQHHNLLVDIHGQKEGPTILLCSHIDTVEALGTWKHDPFGAEKEEDKIFGLGSNDAGASVVSLMAATRLINTPHKGRILLSFVVEEEVGSQGFYTVEPELPHYNAAIFGEPTNLRAATYMRGAMKALVKSRGTGCHASLPWEGKNAIDQMITDVLAVRSINLTDNSPWGGATIEPTLVHGGRSSNQIPDLVETTLDIRTTPEKDNDWILGQLKKTGAEIEILHNRRKPMFNKADSKIVQAFRENYPNKTDCVFNGTCDMAFSKAPSIILGPGDLKMAHVADEYTRPSEIKQAIMTYQRVINTFLSL